ncbi:MAG: hypothetical protein V2B20_19535 [Pseudomonadota bacterium]
MQRKPSAIFFDDDDYQLLRIVNDVLERGPKTQALRSLLVEYMHPHGIKEMAAPRGLRIAYAIAGLLGSFEKGKAVDRIKALRSLRDEVFLPSPTFFQKNTARVLLQIMKQLVRSKDNKLRQLKLAHDFRMVSMGNPRKVRTELAKYHLIEMPEEWNQVAFDDHVHDANTKGRKSPTHLVMDAWIKGIRYLTVVYYNYVRPEVVEELIEASSILDIRVQVGIEMSVRFRDKYARFTWEPHGFHDNRSFLQFLGDEAVGQMMDQGRKVSEYQQKYVFEVLQVFNDRHRKVLSEDLEISLDPLNLDDFIGFVGTGQPSVLHLGRFIHNTIIRQIREKLSDVTEGGEEQHREEESPLKKKLAHAQGLNVENIINEFLLPIHNPEVNDPTVPKPDADLPDLLQFTLGDLLSKLQSLHSSSKFTLNLGNLSVQDTLELLYAGEGKITHIEAFNLKNVTHALSAGVTVGVGHANGENSDRKSSANRYNLITELQKALNDNNVINLKRVIRAIILDYEEQYRRQETQEAREEEAKAGDGPTPLFQQMEVRKLELLQILANLETLHNYYKKRTLCSRIGSGSTGQTEHQHGMGFVVLDTLPARAQKLFYQRKGQKDRALIPVSALLTKNSHQCLYNSANNHPRGTWRRNLPFCQGACGEQWLDWSLDGFQVHVERSGNIATLGGVNKNTDNEFLAADSTEKENVDAPWKYLNTNLKNTMKVFIGFIPAFLTFFLTKDWWALAYLGAFIWFGITGSRNIIQSVLGGGGLRRSPLLPWNSLISWSRISDSLLYTGFSVPLLDYLVKTLLLDRALGITTGTNPIILYSVMGLVNGMYISSHNVLRGLPKGATFGNLFRSILAIPVAVFLNTLIGAILAGAGIPDVTGVLQKWAAILSKFASDCVAAVIEGLADRQSNICERLAEYHTKVSQLFEVFSRLDMLFPEQDVLDMLQSPKNMMRILSKEAQEMEKLIIVNALDLMYFWMYQPRARKALTIISQNMSPEEWRIFYSSQLILKRHKEISQVFVDGLVGKNFRNALGFYLARSQEHLSDLKRLGNKRNVSQG